MKQSNSARSFEIIPNEGYKILKLVGSLESDSVKEFSESMEEIVGAQPTDVILNFESVSELSTSWIRVLMALQQALKATNKQLRLISVSKEVLSFLKREGVHSTLKQQPDLKAALVDLKITSLHGLDVNFINPFLAAAIKVLETQASTKSTAGKIYKKDPREKFTGDISGVIGLVSEVFTGSVVISFPAPTFLKIMSRMLGEDCKEITKDIEDGAGELTNMIFGQAKIALNAKGYGIKTALPSVVSGSDHSILQMSRGPRMAIPFQSDAGDFFIEVSVSG